MALIVQKFGGTSVGSIERIQHVANKIRETKLAGHDVVVVVSAMSGETDRLIKLAQGLSNTPKDREYDILVSTGEQVTMSLLAIALENLGCPARSYTGAQAGILTDHLHTKARIVNIQPDLIMRDLQQNRVVIVAGFQGVNADGDVTTLGRGGSDTTGVALAAALKADECQIYTDVDGVYTTDPRLIPEAQRLPSISFEEMLEMASLGAKVLQMRSVELASKNNMPIRVLSSFVDGPGTLVTFEEKIMQKRLVSGIAFTREEAVISLVGIPNRVGIEGEILDIVSAEHIEVDMIAQNASNHDSTFFTFTVNRKDEARTLQLMQALAVKLGAVTVKSNAKAAKLSLVGLGMRSHTGVASTMFRALGQAGIPIQMITTSEIKISVIIDEEFLESGVRAVHEAFELHKIASERQHTYMET